MQQTVSLSIVRGITNLRIANTIAATNDGRVHETPYYLVVSAERKLVVQRRAVEDAVGSEIGENAWHSLTWNVQGRIAKTDREEIVIESELEEAM
jgi:hypothetical protein